MNVESEIAIRYPSYSVKESLSFYNFHQKVNEGVKINKGEVIGYLNAFNALGAELIAPVSGKITYINSGNWNNGQLIIRIKTTDALYDSNQIADDLFQKVLLKCEQHYSNKEETIKSLRNNSYSMLAGGIFVWIVYIITLLASEGIWIGVCGLIITILLTMACRGVYLNYVEQRIEVEKVIALYPGRYKIQQDYRSAVSIHG